MPPCTNMCVLVHGLEMLPDACEGKMGIKLSKKQTTCQRTYHHRRINLFVRPTATGEEMLPDVAWIMDHTRKVIERDEATNRVHASTKSLISGAPRKAETAFINSVRCPFRTVGLPFQLQYGNSCSGFITEQSHVPRIHCTEWHCIYMGIWRSIDYAHCFAGLTTERKRDFCNILSH